MTAGSPAAPGGPMAGLSTPLRVIDGPGALRLVGELIAGAGPGGAVVLAAATPITVRGRSLREVIEGLAGGRALRWVVLGPPDGRVHADEATVSAASAAAADAGCVLTVGSGTITDIGKAAVPAGVRLVAVQTATSVNGYADPFCVLLRDGVKRTTPARWPDVLVIDDDVLLGAPPRLRRAGIGDMAAMFTAQADWYLAAAAGAGGPPYSGKLAGLVRSPGQRMFTLATDQAPGVGELATLLTLSGLTMGLAGGTAPASGMEHAISHLLEMAADARPAEPGNLHGAVVGVASVVAAATWAQVTDRIAAGALGRPARLPDPRQAADQLGAALAHLDPTGAMTAECLADYAAKARLLAAKPDPLAALRAWEVHDRVLSGLLTAPETIASGLRAAGLPAAFAELPVPVDETAARWAVANCALQRRRFGVADLAMLLGAWDDEDVTAVLDRAARAAAAVPAFAALPARAARPASAAVPARAAPPGPPASPAAAYRCAGPAHG